MEALLVTTSPGGISALEISSAYKQENEAHIGNSDDFKLQTFF